MDADRRRHPRGGQRAVRRHRIGREVVDVPAGRLRACSRLTRVSTSPIRRSASSPGTTDCCRPCWCRSSTRSRCSGRWRSRSARSLLSPTWGPSSADAHRVGGAGPRQRPARAAATPEVALTFTALTGSSQIDDVFVDPPSSGRPPLSRTPQGSSPPRTWCAGRAYSLRGLAGGRHVAGDQTWWVAVRWCSAPRARVRARTSGRSPRA